MWMHNNIFFSVAVNVNGMFDGLGGEEAAHKNASHEITGIRLLRSAGVAGLNACAQCVVDYRGKRVICQSVVPGLLSQGDLTLAINSAAPAEDKSEGKEKQEETKKEEAGATAAAAAASGASDVAAAVAAASEKLSNHSFGPTDDMNSYIENAEFAAMTSELGRRLGLAKTSVRVGEATVQVILMLFFVSCF